MIVFDIARREHALGPHTHPRKSRNGVRTLWPGRLDLSAASGHARNARHGLHDTSRKGQNRCQAVALRGGEASFGRFRPRPGAGPAPMGGPQLVRRSPASHPRPLTVRECATLERKARGMTHKMIAFEFGISINTVGNLAAKRVPEARRPRRRGRGACAPGRALLLRNPRRFWSHPRASRGEPLDVE